MLKKEILCDFSSLSALHVCHIFAICRATTTQVTTCTTASSWHIVRKRQVTDFIMLLQRQKKSQALSMSPAIFGCGS